MTESSDLPVSSMSFFEMIETVPEEFRNSISFPDSRTTNPSKVWPELRASFLVSNPWAILALGLRIDSVSSVRL